jgi:hypothetical protein
MLPNLLLGWLRDVQAFRQKKCRFARVHVAVKSNNIKCKLKVLGTKIQKNIVIQAFTIKFTKLFKSSFPVQVHIVEPCTVQ